jgi:hypothetical protein
MVAPQPTTYTPITYTPQFQAPVWQDNVDLVLAGGPNGFNTQFKSLQAEFDMLKGIVQQLNTTISTSTQVLNDIVALVTQANTTSDAANKTANAAIATANAAIATANAAIATAMKAIQAVNNLPPLASLTVNVNQKGVYAAECSVSYDDRMGQPQKVWSPRLYVNNQWSAIVPGGAKNIRVFGKRVPLIEPTIFDQGLSSPLPQASTSTIYLSGTKTNPTFNITYQSST